MSEENNDGMMGAGGDVGDGLSMAEMMGAGGGGDGSPPIGSPPVAAASGDGAGQPAPATGYDLERFLKECYPEAPEGMPKVDNWKSQRTLAEKTLRSLGSVSLELDSAKRELAEARKAGGGVLPEAEAVRKLQAELEAVKQEKTVGLAEWEARKARDELEGNHAFLAEFDGRRVALRDEAGEVAREAGVSDEVVAAVFAATSEYAITRALEGVEDETASRLIREKALGFAKIGKERDAAVKAPADSLKAWRDYDGAMRGQMALGARDEAVKRYVGAAPEVDKALAGDPFFQTPAGKAVVDGLMGQVSQGMLPNAAQVLTFAAQAQAASFYQTAWSRGREELAAALAKVARYEAAEPSQSGVGGQRAAADSIGDGWFS